MINKPFFTTAEVAKMSGKSRVAIFKKIKSGQIKAKKQGRNYIIPAQEAEKINLANLASANDAVIKKAVGLAVKDYGETFKLLGQE